MKLGRLLFVVTCMVSIATAQKLFFKSNKVIQEELKELKKVKDDVIKGFGFVERKYFNVPKTPPPAEQKATCCLDKKHCCPFGTKCDFGRQACISGDTVVPWFEKTPGTPINENTNVEVSVGTVQCPDGEHECPDGHTCCRSAEGYSCCPLPHAVCCSDQVHCCPANTVCDLTHGKCIPGDGSFVAMSKKQYSKMTKIKSPVLDVTSVPCDDKHACPTANTCCLLPNGEWGCCPKLSEKVENVKCDSTHECPSENTCCRLASGQWGCCPLPEAVCCSDGVHCCPSGDTCDVSQGKCNRGNVQTGWFKKQPAIKVGGVKCDSTHECPNGNTCCKLASGQWGCCPLPEAVCCSDGVHCCPAGETCDVSHGKCNRGNIQTDWFKKQPAIKVGGVKCDSTHECPDGNTCCELASGQWGCCPLPEAVCCSDGVHCCPAGDTCDVSQGKCNRGDIQTDWLKKQPAIKVGGVKCDSTHECPNENTCCKLASGQWGCCPLPEAVCCSDGVHCCPAGDTCDVSQGKCNRGDIQTDWLKKQPAIKVGGVKCDSTHECPDGNTCCKLASGQWGCCPLPEAVCCNDGVHCCPAGDTCDVSQGKCNRGDIQTDWLKKQPAIKVDNVECDSTHSCPSGNTCCKLASGQWGCCPLPEAVCCSDGLHCCPYGTTCDTSAGKCNSNNIKSDLIAMSAKKEEVNDVICPDGSECRDGETCCKMGYADSYGCCPMPNAVCCDDGQHCCPHSYKCNIGSGMCVKGMLKLPWIRTNVYSKHNSNRDMIKINDIISSKKNRESVTCSDQTVCPDQYSCCPNGKGGYNCCPMPAGVCCSDNIHCCPHGYICDEEPGICRIPELDKTSSEFIRKLGSKKAIPHS
ncbi:hypothetical protein ACF0H5_018536 [Mactra antiquata]